MSFQDVGQQQQNHHRRRHPIFDNHRGRPVDDDPSSSPSLPQSGTPLDEPQRPRLPKSKRGVKPRLSTKCPVTRRTLMDEVTVQSSVMPSVATTPPTSSDDDDQDDHAESRKWTLPTVTPSPRKNKRASIFAKWTNELVQFQKMISELESLLPQAGTSPEAQWRTRILLRSAKQAHSELQSRLDELPPNVMSSRKVHRDWQRIQTHYEEVCQSYQRQQQAQVSSLTNSTNPLLVMESTTTTTPRSPTTPSSINNNIHNILHQAKQPPENNTVDDIDEDFFVRAMRERQVEKIQQQMCQVHDIYQNLEELVEGQQEQITKVAEATHEAKENTQAGLQQIQEGMMNGYWCGGPSLSDSVMDDDDDEVQHEWRIPEDDDNDDIVEPVPMTTDIRGGIPKQSGMQRPAFRTPTKDANHHHKTKTAKKKTKKSKTKSNGFRVGEDFQWSMPLETFRQDMQAVHEDIVQMGRQLMADTMCTEGYVDDKE